MSVLDMNDEDYNPDIYTLTDEEGVEQAFEMLGELEHKGNMYYALVPYYENPEEMLEDEDPLIVLKRELDEEGEEMMVSIDDDDEYQEVGNLFIKELSEMFEEVIFEDDE